MRIEYDANTNTLALEAEDSWPLEYVDPWLVTFRELVRKIYVGSAPLLSYPETDDDLLPGESFEKFVEHGG